MTISVQPVYSEGVSSSPHSSRNFSVFLGSIRFKERPWGAFRCVERILGQLSHKGEEEEKQLEALGWKPIKSFAPILDNQILSQATHYVESDKLALDDLARHVYLKDLTTLKNDGWSVSISDNFPFRPLEQVGNWYAQLDKAMTTTTDWFDLELGIMIDGTRLNILPMLVSLFKSHKTRAESQQALEGDEKGLIYVPLQDGKLLPVPAEKVQFIAKTLIELHDSDALTSEGKLRLSSWQSTQILEIEAAMRAAQMRWFGDDKIRELGQKLKDFSQIVPVEKPKGLQCELRSYQVQGVSWLQFLRENNLNGVLADDMGLGKTVQTLAHILLEKESGRMTKPVLVVAPTSLMTNWRMEATKYTPTLKVLILHGTDRKELFDRLEHADIVLTTYPLLTRDKDFFIRHQFHMLVLDEAQVIKNPNTMSHRVVQQINAQHRLCLTGTPMENHLGELWSLFYFLMPGFLGDQRKFNNIYRTPIEKFGNEERRQNLSRRVRPFMLRRTKSQVVSELPPKTEIIQNIELLPQQRALYETIRLTMHERVQQEIRDKGLSRSHIVILDALLKLRQVCCDPRLLKLDVARDVTESAKIQFLLDMLPEMINENRQILLFSQFTSMLALIETELQKVGIPYAKLTGQTKDRAAPIEQFQRGEVPIFLISLKAGGTGLNLTAADTVIHFDPWWNPAVENQATDRAYRIGQNKPVFVYKLMTVGTVEEKIMAMQKRKSTLLSGIFNTNTEQTDGLFTSRDLEALFEPLE